MKKLLIFLIFIVFLSGCSTASYDRLYEVHFNGETVVTVCGDDALSLVKVGVIIERNRKNVAMFAGEDVWYTSTPVDSCEDFYIMIDEE